MALEKGLPVEVGKLRGCAEFLRGYADERHHQREEAILFPLLVKRGVPPQGCPIGGLNNDHAKGRVLLSALDQQLASYEPASSGAGPALRQTLQDLSKLYRHHLWMEDAMVFPMAEKLISEEDNREMTARFDELDRAIGTEVVARWEQFAHRLTATGEPTVAG